MSTQPPANERRNSTSLYEEGGLIWRKSSASGNGGCVEVAFDASEVHVRDTENRQGGFLSVSPSAWSDLVEAIRHGHYDME
jgi:hypothetical protein